MLAADVAKEKWGGIFKTYFCCECLKFHIGHLITKQQRDFRSRLNSGQIRGR
jgi:hypothetical protein